MGGGVFSGTEYSRTVDNSTLNLYGGTSWTNGAQLQLFGKNWVDPGAFVLYATSDANTRSMLYGKPNGTLTWNGKNLAMQEDTIPRSGGAVMRGDTLYKSNANGIIFIGGGDERNHGGNILLCGSSQPYEPERGAVAILPNINGQEMDMHLYPSGTWIWNGTAVQITSDQRLKQQIAEIDDKLLDAWESVELCQFKYNDAVDQKGDTARLHTGYVVQQIDNACKSHNVDISDYGLYCHEEYPEETEEVEVTQEDGTTSKETKVIKESSEHYSLRYTEVYAVECAYLRREVSRLKHQNEDLEQRLKMLEQSVK